jgi:hypothetical protein
VIVRISSEGQYELPDDQAERLNELDNRLVTVCEGGDENQFDDLWGQMVELVRSGTPVPDDELVGSDVILPPSDTTMAEAAAEFTGEGLIPD